MSIIRKGDDGSSSEILKIISEPWSFQSVATEFESFVREILGEEHTQSFIFSEFIEDFKQKFKFSRYGEDKSITLQIPCGLLRFDQGIKTTLNSSKYLEKISIKGDKMRWKNFDFFNQFGEKAINRIIGLIKSVPYRDLEDVETFLLIGSFSCDYVKHAVGKSFPKKRVVVLDSNEVLQGAVYIGHMEDRQSISS